jgi:sugar lactone lactonase YvrE
MMVPASAAAADPACEGWQAKTLAEGLGSLENIEPDGSGGLLISATTQGAIVRLTPDGKTSVLIPGVTAPGGLRVRDGRLFFNTGDSFQAGVTGSTDGTIDTFDFASGKRATYASGLTMPNGLAFLPNGDAVTSRDVNGGPTGITRVPASDPSKIQTRWAALADSNGMAVDPSGKWLYVVETFTAQARVYRVLIADPTQIEVVAELAGVGSPAPKGLDDMTIDSAGVLYITANGSGEVLRLDPATGAACAIAGGFQNTSAVKFGAGPGWPSDHLYVTGFDGLVRELTPPPGAVPPPVGPPSVRAPKIRLRATPRRVRAGRRTCVRLRATAGGVTVRGARVRLGGKRARTGRRGRARVCVRLKRGVHVARATKPGLRGGRAKVRAVRG